MRRICLITALIAFFGGPIFAQGNLNSQVAQYFQYYQYWPQVRSQEMHDQHFENTQFDSRVRSNLDFFGGLRSHNMREYMYQRELSRNTGNYSNSQVQSPGQKRGGYRGDSGKLLSPLSTINEDAIRDHYQINSLIGPARVGFQDKKVIRGELSRFQTQLQIVGDEIILTSSEINRVSQAVGAQSKTAQAFSNTRVRSSDFVDSRNSFGTAYDPIRMPLPYVPPLTTGAYGSLTDGQLHDRLNALQLRLKALHDHKRKLTHKIMEFRNRIVTMYGW